MRNALYSTKEATRVRYGKITKFLTQSSYSMVHADSNLFVKPSDRKLTITLVYVDDLILTSDSEKEN